MSYFEMQLKPEQQIVFEYFMAQQDLKPGEFIIRCPFCQYFEVRETSVHEMMFFHCARPLPTTNSCERVSCVHCKREVWIPDDGIFDEEQEEDQLEMMKHFQCAELSHLREGFEKARTTGEQSACPQCGLKGRKDDACTHMTCASCSQRWCYFCGLREEDADCDAEALRKGSERIYAHNVNWETNPSRCPMYLVDIHQIDDWWPENDEACLNLFHKQRAVRSLRKFKDEVGDEQFLKLWHAETMGAVRGCGHTLEEI
ncbi:unnamed protein product, partial [Heterosigma akashiwo]